MSCEVLVFADLDGFRRLVMISKIHYDLKILDLREDLVKVEKNWSLEQNENEPKSNLLIIRFISLGNSTKKFYVLIKKSSYSYILRHNEVIKELISGS